MLDRVTFALRALRSRNLRLFFAGQGISLVGSWMQQLAMGWLVYRVTGSTVALGVIAVATQLPAVAIAPLAGALSDRWSRYRLVVLAQTLAMVQAAAVAILVLTGLVEVWHLVALAVMLGGVTGLDVPARQSLLVKLVDSPEDLPNAIALNSSLFNLARLLGPAIGGILVSWVGEGPVFALNAVSYIAVLGALRGVRIEEDRRGVGASMLRFMWEGLGYARRFSPIGGALLLLAGVSLVGVPYVVLLPPLASEVLDGGADTLGLLTACAGLGALVGALYMASRPTVRGLGRIVVRSTVSFGAALILLSLSRSAWLSAGILVLVGFGVLVTTASINTVLQTLVDEAQRGRIMSLYTVAFVGAGAVGSFLGGWLAAHWGVPATIAVGGAASIAMGLLFALRLPALRAMVQPVYARLGILPEVATGVNRASELRPRV